MRIQRSYGRHVCQPTSKMSLKNWQCFITATDFYLTVPVTQDKGLMGDPWKPWLLGLKVYLLTGWRVITGSCYQLIGEVGCYEKQQKLQLLQCLTISKAQSLLGCLLFPVCVALFTPSLPLGQQLVTICRDVCIFPANYRQLQQSFSNQRIHKDSAAHSLCPISPT